jgi:alpha-D-xyloside xylohydrolase
VGGGAYRLETSFLPNAEEQFYGMGQHQHGRLDNKGCIIELEQRNTEVSIPFLVSNRGYGFLWNNPAIGRAELGFNGTRWVAEATRQLDYYVVVGDNPAELLERYAEVTGHAPMLPEWAAGFWQCKLRYKTQQELLQAARAAPGGDRDRLLPLDDDGRVEIRPEVLAGPGRHGARAERAGRQGDGVCLAGRESLQ